MKKKYLIIIISIICLIIVVSIINVVINNKYKYKHLEDTSPINELDVYNLSFDTIYVCHMYDEKNKVCSFNKLVKIVDTEDTTNKLKNYLLEKIANVDGIENAIMDKDYYRLFFIKDDVIISSLFIGNKHMNMDYNNHHYIYSISDSKYVLDLLGINLKQNS